MQQARFWEKAENNQVQCELCRFRCLIGEDKRGICGVRENRHGILYSLVYGRAVAANVDPIEKKPLFHFLPGSQSFSVATVGCNFRCRNCQNYQISQWHAPYRDIPGERLSPEEIVRLARRSNCQSISYTYTEPTIYFEYAYDTAVLANAAGLRNVFVSNGYTSNAALETIAPVLDAANIDLKGFSAAFYKDVVGASLEEVLDCLRTYKRLGIWLEVTTLVIPGHNDDEHQLRDIARFIRDELSPNTPWHVSAFYPTYKLTNAPPTPASTLRKAREIGLDEGLSYVYTGNLPGDPGETTRCPACRKEVVVRSGFRLGKVALDRGKCLYCGNELAGVWK